MKRKHFKNFNATVCSYIVLCEHICLLSVQLHANFSQKDDYHTIFLKA